MHALVHSSSHGIEALDASHESYDNSITLKNDFTVYSRLHFSHGKLNTRVCTYVKYFEKSAQRKAAW
jgi:hypothetical protein